jgi:hypothetical protein
MEWKDGIDGWAKCSQCSINVLIPDAIKVGCPKCHNKYTVNEFSPFGAFSIPNPMKGLQCYDNFNFN